MVHHPILLKEKYYAHENENPTPLPTIMLGAGRGAGVKYVQRYVEGIASSS